LATDITKIRQRGPCRALVTALGVCAVVGLLDGCDSGCPGTRIQVSWHLVQFGHDVECVPGDTVSMRVDTDQMIVDFPCQAGVGLTPPVEGDVVHSVSLTLTDGRGNVLSQTADMGLGVGCGGTTIAPEVEFDL
jgi:hypothetical protein